MLIWLAGTNGGPSTVVGEHGTNVGAHVPSELYGTLLASYLRADLAEIQLALDELVRAFPRLAQGVANAMGYRLRRSGRRTGEHILDVPLPDLTVLGYAILRATLP
jgi:Streptomycin adenylyltransferase